VQGDNAVDRKKSPWRKRRRHRSADVVPAPVMAPRFPRNRAGSRDNAPTPGKSPQRLQKSPCLRRSRSVSLDNAPPSREIAAAPAMARCLPGNCAGSRDGVLSPKKSPQLARRCAAVGKNRRVSADDVPPSRGSSRLPRRRAVSTENALSPATTCCLRRSHGAVWQSRPVSRDDAPDRKESPWKSRRRAVSAKVVPSSREPERRPETLWRRPEKSAVVG
jgi:hypothetical protein